MNTVDELRELELSLMKNWLKPRTVFTTMFYTLFCYLILKGVQIPPVLNTIVSSLFGFWFGQKTANKTNGSQNKEEK